jgi:hypothetical protein
MGHYAEDEPFYRRGLAIVESKGGTIKSSCIMQQLETPAASTKP